MAEIQTVPPQLPPVAAPLIAGGNGICLCKACSKSSPFLRRIFTGMPARQLGLLRQFCFLQSSALPVLLPAPARCFVMGERMYPSLFLCNLSLA